MSEQYKVGYRHPPLHTRFKKGERRNPYGRPKKKPTYEDMQRKLLFDDKRVVRENGRRLRVSNLEAILRVQLIRALNGDVRSAQLLLKLAADVARAEPEKEKDRHAESANLLVEAIRDTFAGFPGFEAGGHAEEVHDDAPNGPWPDDEGLAPNRLFAELEQPTPVVR
jgi:hypothetical protein